MSKVLAENSNKFIYLRANNYFANIILDPAIHNNCPDNEQICRTSETAVELFIKENNICLYLPREKHIWSTWKAYFNGQPPFKEIKNRKDIPDAWILECAKDALSDERNTSTYNKFCLVEDKELCLALNTLGFKEITVLELVKRLEKEEAGVVPKLETPKTDLPQEANEDTATIESLPPLDALLTKALDASVKGIYLRLLGFVVALDAPSHEALIDAVVSKGFDRKLTEACAVILSNNSKPYIKDTGNHYIVENKEICIAAADRLTHEIIEMLG